MKRALIIALSGILLSQTGCAPVLVGGLIWHDQKVRDSRKEFTMEFQKQNFEREKAGLSKLDWCEEVYRFDQNWYSEDKRCKALLSTLTNMGRSH